MPLVTGQRLTADLLNGYLVTVVGNSVITGSSASTSGTTEIAAISVTGTLVAGTLYQVFFVGKIGSPSTGVTSTETVVTRIREDSLTGTQQGLGSVFVPTTSGNGYEHCLMAEYTAAVSGSKTFVLTLQRTGTPTGSGAHAVISTASGPSFMTITAIPQ